LEEKCVENAQREIEPINDLGEVEKSDGDK
jgi:hypothetical protein